MQRSHTLARASRGRLTNINIVLLHHLHSRVRRRLTTNFRVINFAIMNTLTLLTGPLVTIQFQTRHSKHLRQRMVMLHERFILSTRRILLITTMTIRRGRRQLVKQVQINLLSMFRQRIILR